MAKNRDRQRANRKIKQELQTFEKTNGSKIIDPTAYQASTNIIRSKFIKPKQGANPYPQE